MCGLVGVVGNITAKQEKIFKNLLQLDVVRGPHSTGAVSVRASAKWAFSKAAMVPDDFFQLRSFKDLITHGHVALMGHNRYATVGAVNAANAHPFEHDGVVGMHNGTLTGWRQSLVRSHEFDVDSDCLIANIAEFGADDTIPDVEGAWALTWYDQHSHTLSILRNDQRPLYWCTSEDGKTMYYASEPWMLRGACWRNNEKITDPEPFKEDTLYEFELPKFLNGGLPKPKARTVEGFIPPPSPPAVRNGGGANKRQPYQRCEEVMKEESKLRKHVNQEVCFIFNRFVLSDKQARRGYMLGESNCYEGHAVRMYCTEKDADGWLEYIDDLDFVGKVSSLIMPYQSTDRGLVDGCLVIDPKSIDFAPQQWCTNEEDDDIPFDPLPDNVVPLGADVIGPDGKPITKYAFDVLTKEGCANCSANIFYGDNIEWTHDGQPLCEHCVEEIREELRGATVS